MISHQRVTEGWVFCFNYKKIIYTSERENECENDKFSNSGEFLEANLTHP